MSTISFWKDIRGGHFWKNDFHFFWMGFHHLHFCKHAYQLIFERIDFIYISVQMTTNSFWMDCRYLHFCTNDCHLFLSGLSSFTFKYEWLPSLFEWMFVMYVSIRMTTISLYMVFCHAHSVKWLSIFLSMDFCHGFSVQMTFHILLVFHDVFNALQRVNSMVQWRIINDIKMYIGFWPCF